MKKIKKIFLVILFSLLAIIMLFGCKTTTPKYNGFYLQYVTKTVYTVGEILNIEIKEKEGSPQGYNIYRKMNEEEYSLAESFNVKDVIVVNFEQKGYYHIKVVALVGDIEQVYFQEADFLVVDAAEMELQRFIIKNNIVDLYYNVNNQNDSYDINNDMEVVYFPDYTTQRNLTYLTENSESVSVQDGKVKAVGYENGQRPYVLPFSCASTGKDNIKANMYFRVNNSVDKTDLTDIFAGYVNQSYYSDSWVDFQFMEYAGMIAPDDYIVARKIDDAYVDLPSVGSDAEIEKVLEHGITFYRVKVVEPSGGYMSLRIYAKINNQKSDIYTDVNIQISQSAIKVNSINLVDTQRTILLDQTYQIKHSVIPEYAYDKTVTYQIEDDGDEYIDIDENGVITPKKASNNPITIKVISNSNEEAIAEFQLNVLGYTEDYFDIQYQGSLTQKIPDIDTITFEVKENYQSVTWLLDGEAVSSNPEFEFDMNAPFQSGQRTLTAKITTNDDMEVYIDKEISIESAFEFVELYSTYELNSPVEFKYDTELEDVSVVWVIYTEDGEPYDDNVENPYTFTQADKYRIVAKFSRYGLPLENKYSYIISVIDNLTHELFNVHTNGYYDGEDYAPLIKWYNIPMDAEITIETVKGTQTNIYSSQDETYSVLFTSDSFKVPCSDLNLEDSFKYRIKTDISDRYTPFIYYNADIKQSEYVYLENIPNWPENLNMNRYINNIHDLAKLLNYLQVFRPNAVQVEENDAIEIVLYFALDFEDIKDSYEVFEPITTTQTETKFINASKLIQAANTAYGAGIGMDINFHDTAGDGIELRFILPPHDEIDEELPDEEINDDIVKLLELQSSTTRQPTNDVFPSSLNSNTIEVSTSNELFLAASWGMRPIPATGSIAETIYNQAKAILNQIIEYDMNDIEKALAIYDYLCLEIAYDDALYQDYMDRISSANTEEDKRSINKEVRSNRSFHLEGALLDNRAVCDGISKAFVLLTSIENITSMKLGGQAHSKETEPSVAHAWNAVMLSGKWYYIDATWGRSKTSVPEETTVYVGINHYYFKAIDSDMQNTHVFIGEVPSVADTKLNYFYTYDQDLYIESQSELDTFISELNQDESYCINLYILEDYTGTLSAEGLQQKFSNWRYVISLKNNVALVILISLNQSQI